MERYKSETIIKLIGTLRESPVRSLEQRNVGVPKAKPFFVLNFSPNKLTRIHVRVSPDNRTFDSISFVAFRPPNAMELTGVMYPSEVMWFDRWKLNKCIQELLYLSRLAVKIIEPGFDARSPVEIVNEQLELIGKQTS